MYFDSHTFIATFTIHPVVAIVAQLLIMLAFLLALIRLLKGPDIADRVVALDLIAGIILAYTLFQAMLQANINFMNVSMAIAVVAFLGTVAIARYLELRAMNVEP